VSLDLQGNLIDFTRLDRQLGPPDTAQAAPADWTALLSLTGILASDLHAVPPLWTPDVPSDARAAWVVTGGRAPVRIEAASWKGKPVWVRTMEPWERAERDTRDPYANPIGLAVFVGLVVAIVVGMGAMARYNLRVGRGDMRGATRVAVTVLFGYGLSGALFFRWALDPRQIWIFLTQRIPFFPALAIWLTYLGVEPFLRRRWPHRLIAWTRLLEGKWMDPLVGREALLGLLAGAAGSLAGWLPAILERHPDADSLQSYLFPIGRASDFWGAIANAPPDGVMKGLGGFAVLLLLRVVVRRDFLAWIGLWLLLVGGSVLTLNMTPAYWLGLILGIGCTVLAARVGVVAAVVGWTAVNLIATSTPLTLDFSRWYAWRTGVVAFLLFAMAIWGFRAAMGRRRILPASMLEG